MDKYNGCNKVQSEVSTPQKPKKKRMGWRGFLIRLAISVVVVAFFLCVRFIPLPAFESVRNVLHAIFCFDFFGRTSFGSGMFFGS